MFRRGVLLLGAVLLSGCVTDQAGTDYASVLQKIGPPKAGHSRVVVLQEKRKGLSMALCACDMSSMVSRSARSSSALTPMPIGRQVPADRGRNIVPGRDQA